MVVWSYYIFFFTICIFWWCRASSNEARYYGARSSSGAFATYYFLQYEAWQKERIGDSAVAEYSQWFVTCCGWFDHSMEWVGFKGEDWCRYSKVQPFLVRQKIIAFFFLNRTILSIVLAILVFNQIWIMLSNFPVRSHPMKGTFFWFK